MRLLRTDALLASSRQTRPRFGWYAKQANTPEPFKRPQHQIGYKQTESGQAVLSSRVLRQVAQEVFRSDLGLPGFSQIRVLNVPSEAAFGQWVYQLGEALGKAAKNYGGSVFSPVWFSRREFTESTLPHQDMQYHKGIRAPQRLAILGYPPSPVKSQLWVADVAQACRDHGAWSHNLLQQTLNNPAFWAPYTRPVGQKSAKHYDVVIMNDSETWANSQTQLGVAHYAKVQGNKAHPSQRVFFQLVLRPDPQTPTAWVPLTPAQLAQTLSGQATFLRS